MATGDPFYCFEHKEYMWQCQGQKHGFETDEEYKARIEYREHPQCPSCQCNWQGPNFLRLPMKT